MYRIDLYIVLQWKYNEDIGFNPMSLNGFKVGIISIHIPNAWIVTLNVVVKKNVRPCRQSHDYIKYTGTSQLLHYKT